MLFYKFTSIQPNQRKMCLKITSFRENHHYLYKRNKHFMNAVKKLIICLVLTSNYDNYTGW